MNESFPILRQYASFLLSNHLDDLAIDLVNKTLHHPLNSIKLLNIPEEEIFQTFKRFINKNILLPLINNANEESLKEHARLWKEEEMNTKIKLYDLFKISQLLKLSFIHFLNKYKYDQKDCVILFQEIECFFNIYENQIIEKFEESFTLEKNERFKQTEIQLYTLLKELPETEGALKEIIQYLERELKKKTSELSISEERFDLISRATKDVLWDWDLITNHIWWNEGFKTLFGYNENEIEPSINSWFDRLHSDDKQRVINNINQVIIEGGKQWSDNYRFRRKDNSYALILDRGYVIHDPMGKPYRMVGSMNDITESDEAKKALQLSEDRLKVALKSGEMGIWNFNPITNETMWDERCKEMFGLPLDTKVTYEIFLNSVHPKDRKKIDKAVQNALDPNSNGEYEIEYRTKMESWIKAKGKAYFNENRKAIRFTGTAIDITESKKAEKELLDLTQKLAERENQLKIITNILPAFISYIDKDEKYQYANEFYIQIKNLPGQIYGKTIREVLGERKYKIRIPCIRKVLQGERVSFEDQIQMSDGSEMNVLVNYIPDIDDEGKVRGFVTMGINLTDRIEYEKMLMQKNAELSTINADLDNFIYTASHDLRAPVSNIEGLINSLQDTITEKNKIDEEIIQIIDFVKTSIKKFQGTIKELTEISKIQKNIQEDINKINVIEHIEDIKLELQKLISESGAIIKSNVNDCTVLNFSRLNFRSILYNLMTNAIKYRSPYRLPVIEIIMKRDDVYCILEIKDNGLGIRKELQEKVFGMFKRIHTHVEGSGVGLYIVKRIIENSGGRIEVESEEDVGTIFRVYFKE